MNASERNSGMLTVCSSKKQSNKSRLCQISPIRLHYILHYMPQLFTLSIVDKKIIMLVLFPPVQVRW